MWILFFFHLAAGIGFLSPIDPRLPSLRRWRGGTTRRILQGTSQVLVGNLCVKAPWYAAGKEGLGREIIHWTSLIAMRRNLAACSKAWYWHGEEPAPFSCRLVVLSSCIRDWRSLGKVRENEEEEADKEEADEEEEEEEEKQKVRVWTVSDLGLQIPFHDKTKAWYRRTRWAIIVFFFSPFLLEMKKTSVVSWRTWDS